MTPSNAESSFSQVPQSQGGCSSEPLTSPPTRVRSARLDDLAQLSEVLASSFYGRAGLTGWLYPLLKLGISEDLRQRLRSHPPHYVCLAAIEQNLPAALATKVYTDCVAGTIELSQRHPLPWQPIKVRHLYLSNLAVHADFRRRGVALQLLQACERIALDWGFSELYLHVMEDNLQARQLYRKAGFRLVQAKEPSLPWLRYTPRRLLMHKSLAEPTVPAAP